MNMSRCGGLSVRKCGARCLFERVRLGEMTIAPCPFLILRASGTSFASRTSRSDPAGACLVVLGAPGLQPWAMGRYHEGPARSCPKGAYSSDKGLHQPERSRAHGFQPRTPLTVHLRLSIFGVSLSKPPQPTPDAKGAGVPERKIGSEALAASATLRDGSSCKGTLNPLPGLGSSTHGTTLFTVEPKVCAISRGRKRGGLRNRE